MILIISPIIESPVSPFSNIAFTISEREYIKDADARVELIQRNNSGIGLKVETKI